MATTNSPKSGGSAGDNSVQQLRDQRDQATDPAERERLDAQVRDAEAQASQTGESGTPQR